MEAGAPFLEALAPPLVLGQWRYTLHSDVAQFLPQPTSPAVLTPAPVLHSCGGCPLLKPHLVLLKVGRAELGSGRDSQMLTRRAMALRGTQGQAGDKAVLDTEPSLVRRGPESNMEPLPTCRHTLHPARHIHTLTQPPCAPTKTQCTPTPSAPSTYTAPLAPTPQF